MTLYNRPPTAVGLAMQDGDWVEVGESLRSGVWPRMEPMYLHYKTTPQAEITAARRAGGGSAGYLEPITEIDVLYGGKEVNPLYGYERLEPMITGGEDDSGKVDFATGKGRFGSSLALRRSLPGESPPVPETTSYSLTLYSSPRRARPEVPQRRKLHHPPSRRSPFLDRPGSVS
jgi:hypothetical protein